MKKTLNFTIQIQAPRKLVWEITLSDDGYRIWTAAFCDGSFYWGSWDEGNRIQFLAPSGNGAVAVIAENRLYEYISIQHIGEITNGEEDTTSDKVKAWAPAYENYEFSDEQGGTKVEVSLDTIGEYESFMQTTFPKALEKLKELCEAKNFYGTTA